MATFSIVIPDEETERVTVALCATAGVDPSAENALIAVIAWITQTTANYETQAATAAALASVVTLPTVTPTLS
jgi:hypothetical protein